MLNWSGLQKKWRSTVKGKWVVLTAVTRELFSDVLTAEQIDRIRDSLEKGHALGNDRFRAEMERLTGIRQHSVKPGPKPSAKTGPGSGEDNLKLLL
jgi:hypothetical protein